MLTDCTESSFLGKVGSGKDASFWVLLDPRENEEWAQKYKDSRAVWEQNNEPGMEKVLLQSDDESDFPVVDPYIRDWETLEKNNKKKKRKEKEDKDPKSHKKKKGNN